MSLPARVPALASAPSSPSWLDADLWPYPGRPLHASDGALHLTEVGSGPSVLFVHGTPTWSIDWRHLIADLSRDHRCLALDHLGFGQSARPQDAGYRPEDHAARFAQALDALDLQDVTVVLHDVGVAIALPWVLDHPERVRRVVVLNGWAWPFRAPSDRRAAAVVGSFVGRWLYRWLNLSLRVLVPSAWADRSRLTPALYAQLRAPFEADRDGRVRVLWAIARGLSASAPFFASIERRLTELADLPMDVVWGLKDSTLGLHHLEAWRRAVPHARVTTLEDAGHWPHVERADAVLHVVRGKGRPGGVSRPSASVRASS